MNRNTGVPRPARRFSIGETGAQGTYTPLLHLFVTILVFLSCFSSPPFSRPCLYDIFLCGYSALRDINLFSYS
jgi:hypothetical protein